MKAAIYARYSSDNQRDESIDAQLRAIKEYCKNQSIEVVKIYTDEALSATSDKRPSFLRMVEDSKNRFFDIAIVHKLDRFARNRYDSAHYKKKLKDNGVRLLSVLENLDDSPESIILESVLEGMAEYYSKNLSREVMKGMKETALQAKHNGGIPPLGLDVTPDKSYSINAKEAEIVREIFNLYISGSGYTNIAHSLNNRGLVTKTTRLFTKISIRDILMNEKYIGTYVFNRRADGKTLNKLKPDEEIIRVQDALPRIIEDKIFWKVQEMLKEGKRGPVVKKEYYLLTGKMFCGECNSAYTGIGYVKGRNKDMKYYQYGCVGRKKNKSCLNKPIRKDVIEEYVINKLKESIFNDSCIDKVAADLSVLIKEYNSTYTDETKRVKNNIKEIESKINKTFEMYYIDHIDKNMLTKKLNELKLELDDAKEKLIYMETKDFTWAAESELKKYLQISRENLESEDKLRQRKVIEAFVDKILIYTDDVKVILVVKNPVSDKVNGGEPHLTISLTNSKEEIYSNFNY